MNTRWIKDNSLLVGFGVAFVLVLGGVGFRFWKQQSAYRQVEADLMEKQDARNRLEGKTPPPTTASLEILTSNNTRVHNVTDELLRLLPHDDELGHRTATNRIVFAQHLRHTLNTLETEAQAAHVKIPKGFRFGFKRYATNLPKQDPALLNRLQQQLSVIHHLTSLMIRDGVEQIDGIYRIDLEEGSGVTSDDILKETVTVHSQDNYMEMPFELRFTCDATSLQKFVNHIVTVDSFFVIRMMNIDQEPLTNENRGTELSATSLTGGGISSAAPTPLSPPRLSVTLRLVFIEFLTAKPKPEAGT